MELFWEWMVSKGYAKKRITQVGNTYKLLKISKYVYTPYFQKQMLIGYMLEYLIEKDKEYCQLSNIVYDFSNKTIDDIYEGLVKEIEITK